LHLVSLITADCIRSLVRRYKPSAKSVFSPKNLALCQISFHGVARLPHLMATRTQSNIQLRGLRSLRLLLVRFRKLVSVTPSNGGPRGHMYSIESEFNCYQRHCAFQSRHIGALSIHRVTRMATLKTRTIHPLNTGTLMASFDGRLPVACRPRYHAPMSVNWPPRSSIATFGPTFEASERKEPKYE
jgi:hypothetical protein